MGVVLEPAPDRQAALGRGRCCRPGEVTAQSGTHPFAAGTPPAARFVTLMRSPAVVTMSTSSWKFKGGYNDRRIPKWHAMSGALSKSEMRDLERLAQRYGYSLEEPYVGSPPDPHFFVRCASNSVISQTPSALVGWNERRLGRNGRKRLVSLYGWGHEGFLRSGSRRRVSRLGRRRWRVRRRLQIAGRWRRRLRRHARQRGGGSRQRRLCTR